MNDLAGITESLRLFADQTRIRLLSLLHSEELTVGELSSVLGQGQSTISSQLSRLKEAGWVQDRRDGTRAYYRMSSRSLGEQGERVWELIAERLEEDPLLSADRDRLEQVVLARSGGAWVDRVAGSLDRRYVPGRGWSAVAAAFAALVELGDCVDMGSGDGALLELLAPRAKKLICVDEHPAMIESGRRRAKQGGYENVSFLESDMVELALAKASADTVLFLQSLQYVRRPADGLKSAARLLRPGGRCLVLTLAKHRDQRIQREYGHEHPGFQPKQLREWMETSGLDVESAGTVGHDERSPQLSILIAIASKRGTRK